MTDLVLIARCPEHGLHGERDTCFVCGGPVEQVAMVPAKREQDAVRLLERADEKKREADRYHRRSLVPAILRILELDEGDIDADDLHWIGPEHPGREDQLYAFDYEGMRFIAGQYWHGNPGRGFLLAVRVSRRALAPPQWPPSHRLSVMNTGWAPAGYRAIYSLAQLADAFERPHRPDLAKPPIFLPAPRADSPVAVAVGAAAAVVLVVFLALLALGVRL